MDVLLEFSTALLQARQRKNVTQESVAFRLGLSHATYNAWECGHRICPLKHIVGLINYFDDEVFTRKVLHVGFTLLHGMSGMDKCPREEVRAYYAKLGRLLAAECVDRAAE